MPRFVILEHDYPTRHWDLFLECGTVLRAWRLLEPPRAGRAIPAEAAPDHRLFYLDYEGPVSGDRGHVQRVLSGSFEWLIDLPDRVEVQLTDNPVATRLVLVQTLPAWSCQLFS